MAFRFDQLTLKSQEAVQQAQSLARDRGHQRLEPLHLLAALLHPDQQVVRSFSLSSASTRRRFSRPPRKGSMSFPRSPAAR